MSPTVTTYSGRRTAEIVDISYRQLDYWARTDLVRPSWVDASGSGSRRAYTFRDLYHLSIIKSLLDSGIRLAAVRTIMVTLAETDEHTDLVVVVSGNSVMLVPPDMLLATLGEVRGPAHVLVLRVVVEELCRRIEQVPAPVQRQPEPWAAR